MPTVVYKVSHCDLSKITLNKILIFLLPGRGEVGIIGRIS